MKLKGSGGAARRGELTQESLRVLAILSAGARMFRVPGPTAFVIVGGFSLDGHIPKTPVAHVRPLLTRRLIENHASTNDGTAFYRVTDAGRDFLANEVSRPSRAPTKAPAGRSGR